MATVSGDSQFTIQWHDVDTSVTLEEEFKTDINRLNVVYDPDAVWIRSNGDHILMIDMNNEHVINALRMCKRNLIDPMNSGSRYRFLLLEAMHRGLMKRDVGEWDDEENFL